MSILLNKEEILNLLIAYENEEGKTSSVSDKDIESWLDKTTGSFPIDREKKIELADAIIEEAKFNDVFIDIINDTITHQLGTTWIGKGYIQAFGLINP